jgi:hypothetical protein
MPASPYQRVIVNGIPVLIDSERNYYYFETSPTEPIRIGSEATGISADFPQLLATRLAAYRNAVESKTRATTKVKSA